ncbi:MAG: hypothetical protein IT366_16275 [Candidatus Hydrogenedentes bacterium]|nr:hypothetical protein [Candidatus Hydrogenedentota bacterium]
MLKHVVRRLVARATTKALRVAGLPGQLAKLEAAQRHAAIRQLSSEFASLMGEGAWRQPLHQFESKVYSQHGEDGIILHILSVIGATDRRFIEFGVEDGLECNTANLSLNFGWSGLLLECDEPMVRRARKNYIDRLGNRAKRVTITQAFITADNINDEISRRGFEGTIDLLSLDIDGNDYWVWKAITVIRPRVVVIEYNSSFGPVRSLTVRYDPGFSRYRKHSSGLYYGASLAALTKLAAEKGYLLAGCDSSGVNAFYVLRDAAAGRIDEVSVEDAFVPQFDRIVERTLDQQYALIKHLSFDEI